MLSGGATTERGKPMPAETTACRPRGAAVPADTPNRSPRSSRTTSRTQAWRRSREGSLPRPPRRLAASGLGRTWRREPALPGGRGRRVRVRLRLRRPRGGPRPPTGTRRGHRDFLSPGLHRPAAGYGSAPARLAAWPGVARRPARRQVPSRHRGHRQRRRRLRCTGGSASPRRACSPASATSTAPLDRPTLLMQRELESSGPDPMSTAFNRRRAQTGRHRLGQSCATWCARKWFLARQLDLQLPGPPPVRVIDLGLRAGGPRPLRLGPGRGVMTWTGGGCLGRPAGPVSNGDLAAEPAGEPRPGAGPSTA